MSVKALETREIINIFIKNELPTILDRFFKTRALEELSEKRVWELAKEYASDIADDLSTYDWRGGSKGQCMEFGLVEEWFNTDVEAELDLNVIFDKDLHAKSCVELLNDEVVIYFWALSGAAPFEEFALAEAVEKWLESLKA